MGEIGIVHRARRIEQVVTVPELLAVDLGASASITSPAGWVPTARTAAAAVVLRRQGTGGIGDYAEGPGRAAVMWGRTSGAVTRAGGSGRGAATRAVAAGAVSRAVLKIDERFDPGGLLVTIGDGARGCRTSRCGDWEAIDWSRDDRRAIAGREGCGQ